MSRRTERSYKADGTDELASAVAPGYGGTGNTANIMLDPLDKELERRGHRFARYADDFLILVNSDRAPGGGISLRWGYTPAR